MLTIKELEKMRDADISKARCDALKNIEEVSVDTSLPIKQRMKQYLEQVENPYCFLCDGLPVKVRFVAEDRQLEKILEEYCLRLKA